MNEHDLVCAALEKDQAEQSAFLEQACAGDPELRRRVELLLEGKHRVSDALDVDGARLATAGTTDPWAQPGRDPSPVAAHSDRLKAMTPGAPSLFATLDPEPEGSALRERRPITEGPGACIGRYKLLQKIGEGGMGAVYLAEQEKPVRRRVALKVVKPGMDTELVLARFEAERQALALMDHPGIAKVLDAGTTDSGRPFFVMELVKGIPITVYCDDARLSTRERLELFVSVCQGIQHAHQKGIIHRDIKPSNVLVTLIDGKPLPKVIDFGVAKAIDQRLTEKTLFTGVGSIVGTLEYMSPEQADLSGLDVDTRSDIYALGVLLYELLTGSTPLERLRLGERGYSQIVKRIKEEEPPKPSTRLSESGEQLASIAARRATDPTRLTRLLRGELDWIVMKALEKDRSRRYETANGFARDVQRFLDGDAVEACPPSSAYRLRKFAAKHRTALVTTASFAAVLLAMSAFSIDQAILATTGERHAQAEALRASRAEAQASSERDRALTAEAQARNEADKAKRAAAESEAVRKFLEDHLLAAARPQGQEGGLGTSATIRQAVDAARPKIAAAFADQPLTEAAVRMTLGTTYYYLGDYDSAITEYERSVQLRKNHLGPEHPDTLESRFHLGSAYFAAGQTLEAIALDEETLRLRVSKLGPGHADTLESRSNLATAYQAAGRNDEAIAMYQETLKLMTAKLGPEHYDTLGCRNNLANAYQDAGRIDEAIAMQEETLKLMAPKLGSDHPTTLSSRANLAFAYQTAGRIDEAIAMQEETLRLRTLKLGPDHPDTLLSRSNLAAAYRLADQTDKAILIHQETVRLMTAKLGPDHPRTLACRSKLATAYRHAGRTADAIALYEAILELSKAKLGPDHPDSLVCRQNLAVAYQDAEQMDEAIKLLAAMLPAAKKTWGPAHPNTDIATNSLCDAYESVGRWTDAGTLLRDLVAQHRNAPRSDDLHLAGILAKLGFNLLKQRKPADAEIVLKECLRIRAARQPHEWPAENTRSLLGASLLGQKKYAEAQPLIVGGYERLKACEGKIPAAAKARLNEAAERVVELYETWGKHDRAREWRSKLGVWPDIPAEPFRP
jgi:serine/threonine protein kinase/tetratricopeptide (TPR) repeat protein